MASKSVYEALQEQVFKQVKGLALAEIESNIQTCNRPFNALDIRPGGYVTPEGRVTGKFTNERDNWGYKWQVTVVRGASSARSQEMGAWQYWLQEIVRSFNHKRLSMTYPTSVHPSRSVEATNIEVPIDEAKRRDFEILAVLITVWVYEPRT
jgi:hypothetical protein